MDQDRDKNYSALTLMYLSVFFLDHFEKGKQNVTEKGKVRGPQKTFSNPTAPKNQNRLRKHHYC